MPYNKRSPGTMMSSNAPAETNVIWIDNSTGNNVPKVYDTVSKHWVPISSGETQSDSEVMSQLEQLRRSIRYDIDQLSTEINNIDNTAEIDNLKSILKNLMNNIGDTVQNYYTIEQFNTIIDALATLTYVDMQLVKKADSAKVYNKSETDTMLESKLSRSSFESEMGKKANLEDVYTQNETRLLIQSYVDAEEPNYPPVDMSVYYTKTQSDNIFMPKTDLSIYTTNESLFAQLSDLREDLESTVEGVLGSIDTSIYALKSDSYRQSEIDAKILPLAMKSEVSEMLQGYAPLNNSYSKVEADSRFISKSNLDNYVGVELFNEKLSSKADSTLYYNKSDSDARYIVKSDLNSINESIGKKANISDVYSKSDMFNQTEISELLSKKVDKATLNDYYTSSVIDDKLSKKVDTLDFNTGLGLKADSSSVYNKSNIDEKLSAFNLALSNKADSASLVNYDNKVAMDLKLGAKADISSVYNKTEIDNKLSAKVDSTTLNNYYLSSTVDTKLGTKADVSTIYTRTVSDGKYALKTDLSTLTTTVGTKANSSDVYTKTQSDTSLALKADVSSVYTQSQSESRYTAKTEFNTLSTTVGNKADTATIYTRTQIDTSLALKADISSIYTQTQINTMLANKSDLNHTHTNLHSPFLLGTKMVNESKIGEKKVLAYNSATGQIGYAGLLFQNLLGIGTIIFEF